MADERREKGLELIQRLIGEGGGGTRLPRALGAYTVDHLFGDVWQGPELSVEERSLLTCAILIALNREAEERIHFNGAKRLGIPRSKLEGLITHAAHYAGWPCAVTAARVLEEVWPPEG
jgi:4-carboxymuconolactone decarboxylase